MIERFRIPPRNEDLFASELADRIEKWMNDLQANLDENMDIVLSAVLHDGREMLVQEIGYYNPYFIVLYGADGASVLTHQASLQLRAVPQPRIPDRPRPRVGFKMERPAD
jgi:hypothetical protein